MTEDLGLNELKANPPYPPFKKGGKIPAFTLAEVLVTLGIIGVVAAMTLPMLAENYQRRIVETRLKKFYTTFNQAILRSVEVNGPFDAWGYQIDIEYDEQGNVNNNRFNDINNSFDLYLRPYINVQQTQHVFFTDNTETILYYLADGSAFSYHRATNRDITYYPVNPVRCLKQPANLRRSVCNFYFLFAPTYKNYQTKYHDNKGLEPYMIGWDGNSSSLYTHKNLGCNYEARDPVYCAALIMHNGWEIPKDYPFKIRY